MGYKTYCQRLVAPADCDHLGHMNVARYFQVCSDGIFAFQAHLGLTAEDIADGRRLSFAAVHAECDFVSEVRVGEAIRLELGVLEIGSKWVRIHYRMFAGHPERHAFQNVIKSVLLDLRERRAVAIPADIRADLERHILDEGDL